MLYTKRLGTDWHGWLEIASFYHLLHLRKRGVASIIHAVDVGDDPEGGVGAARLITHGIDGVHHSRSHQNPPHVSHCRCVAIGWLLRSGGLGEVFVDILIVPVGNFAVGILDRQISSDASNQKWLVH